MSAARTVISNPSYTVPPLRNPHQPRHILNSAFVGVPIRPSRIIDHVTACRSQHWVADPVGRRPALHRLWHVQHSVPRTLITASSNHSPSMADDAEKELLQLTQQMLGAIAHGDYATYESMCSRTLTCFEPEAVGHLVEGMHFHKFYFDNLPMPQHNPDKPSVLTTMVNPKASRNTCFSVHTAVQVHRHPCRSDATHIVWPARLSETIISLRAAQLQPLATSICRPAGVAQVSCGTLQAPWIKLLATTEPISSTPTTSGFRVAARGTVAKAPKLICATIPGSWALKAGPLVQRTDLGSNLHVPAWCMAG